MLTINVPEIEYYDASSESFTIIPKHTLELEHSLVSISKWESKWQKAFLTNKEKSNEEIYDYIRCMVVGEPCDMMVIKNLTMDSIKAITDYINSPQTATTINQPKSKPSREVITSELIYYWMIAHNIPFECQNWHLNRLLTLVGVCNVKNEPPKKQNKNDILRRNAALNAARKKSMNTSG